MRQWLVDNDRAKRPAHHYSAERFGLSEDELVEAFSDYRKRFLRD